MFRAVGNYNDEEVIIESTDGIDWKIVENDDEE